MKYVRVITKIFGVILAVYLILSLSFYFFHSRIIFQPDKINRDYVFRFDQPFEEYFIPMHDGLEVNVLLFKTEASQPKGLVLYFHGNADNLQRWGRYAADLTPLGYNVLMVEYRGYGKSGGKPGEADFYQDARTVLSWAEENLDYDRLVILGRSLGAAVATNLAAEANPDVLILETPFDELWGAVYPVFKPTLYFIRPSYQFSNSNHLRKVNCKKLIIHGTRDWVVPLSSALRLKPLLKEGDEFLIIEGGGHNDLREFEEYKIALNRFLND